MTSPLADIFAAVLAWGEGRRSTPHTGTGAAAAVLTDGDLLPVAIESGLVADGTVVLVPQTAGPSVPGTVPYEGSLVEPGGEAVIAEEFYLFTQDYSTSAYLSVIGPTLIRVFGEDDFQAYVDDADRARESGDFAEFLLAPAARLADLPGLGGAAGQAGPRHRVLVDGDGRVRTSPTGADLGGVEQGVETLEREWAHRNERAHLPCAVCLADVVGSSQRADALRSRPWLPDYANALDLLRDLTARGVVGLQVAGFGHHLADVDPEQPDDRGVPRTLLAWNDAEAFVRDVDRGRTFRLNRAAAPAVDALLTSGSVEAASRTSPPAAVASAAAQLSAIGLTIPTSSEAISA